MTSIVENLMASLDSLSNAYAQNIRFPSQKLAEVGDDLRENGKTIYSFTPKHLLENCSLVAVDGGRASQQLAGGDLIVVGATLGDGARSVQRYGDDFISESFATVVAHTSKNENEFAGRMMSALELRVLAQADTDYQIIDGAYLGNVSELLFAFVSDNEELIDTLLEHNKDGLLETAMQKVLYPPRDNSSGLLSVSKSDSSFVYSKMLLGEEELSSVVSDRNLASALLEPGEFFVPRHLETNAALVRALEIKGGKLPSKVKALTDGKVGLLRRMGTLDDTEEGILWTTYFKPSRWTAGDRAIKIEFVYYPSSDGSVIEHAEKLIQIVDDDILNNTILEPWCQYLADRRAKDVSLGIDLMKNYLLNNVESASEAQGLLRGYRT